MVALGSRGEEPGGEGMKCGGAGVSELAASGRDSGLRRWGLLMRVREGCCQRGTQPESLAPGKGPLCR